MYNQSTMLNDDKKDRKIGKRIHWIFFLFGIFYFVWPIYDIFVGRHIYRSIDGQWVNAIGPNHLIWVMPIIVLTFLATGSTIRYFRSGEFRIYPWQK